MKSELYVINNLQKKFVHRRHNILYDSMAAPYLNEPSMEVTIRSTLDCPLLVNPSIVWIFSPAKNSVCSGKQINSQNQWNIGPAHR